MTPRTEEKQLRVADFMSSPMVSVSSETNFVKAIQLVVGNRIGNVVVADNEKFTERDLLNRVIGQGVDIVEKVCQYCSSPFVTAKVVGIEVNEAGRLMFAHKIKRLPLTKWDRVKAAIVTARDLVEAFRRKR